jgi:hypothetical protein
MYPCFCSSQISAGGFPALASLARFNLCQPAGETWPAGKRLFFTTIESARKRLNETRLTGKSTRD